MEDKLSQAAQEHDDWMPTTFSERQIIGQNRAFKER